MENQNNNNEQRFRCTGDCFRCQPIQRQYCAAQWSYNCMRMIESMQMALNAMQGDIGELKVKIEAIQGNEASLFDPIDGTALLSHPTNEMADEKGGHESEKAIQKDSDKNSA